MTEHASPTVIHLTQRLKRHTFDSSSATDLHDVPGGTPTISPSTPSSPYPSATPSSIPQSSPAIPSPIPNSIPSSAPFTQPLALSSPTSASSSSNSLPGGSGIVLTSRFPVTTIIEPSTTITSFSQSIFTSSPSAFPAAQTIGTSLRVNPVCIGDGLDTDSVALLSTVLVPSVIGLLLWLFFAIIRPRYRQLYGLREWFVQQNLRPKPLSRSLWAFLYPHVPLVPSMPSDVSDAGTSAAVDAELFPSDEALGQRTLWLCLVIVFIWSVVGTAGMLPLYMVSTPCLAQSASSPRFTGVYSTLQDMSLLRLLQLLDAGNVTTIDLATSLSPRETVNGKDISSTVRTRIIIATALAIVLGVLPVLWKLIREFNKFTAYRRRWVEVKCQGQEMGWLSASDAPGFVGWGEKRLKEFIVKAGLSASLESNSDIQNGSGNGSSSGRSRRRRRAQDWSNEEKANLEIDVKSLFSVGDTTQLALLIDERDEILENLEVAETKYISSFKLSTPDPSMIDFVPIPPPKDAYPVKPHISRPRPLAGSRRRRRRGRNPAFGSSSLPPTSFVMPSQYYKLQRVQGVNGGQFTDAEGEMPEAGPSLADSFNQRVVGSRFQEVNRNSVTYGRLPIGSQVMDRNGETVPVNADTPVPSTALYGPNGGHASWDTSAFNEGLPAHQWYTQHQGPAPILEEDGTEEEEWVDVLSEAPEAFEHGEEYDEETLRRRPRPPRMKTDDSRRETFPIRNKGPSNTEEEQPPPHLRLQPRQPFVRPLSGLDHDHLGNIYSDISIWRQKLKAINLEIADVQRESYNDIAEGTHVKGWLLVGRGLRYVPGMQLIEGRAKEDIRWDELQNEGGPLRLTSFWTIIITTVILLGVGLTAVAGLSLASAPDVAHYFPFFQRLATGNTVGSGLATGLAAVVAATIFVSLGMWIIKHTGQLGTSVSVSGSRMIVFKTTFYMLTITGAIWLFTVGAIIFAIGAFSFSEQESKTVANGAIYMSAFAFMLIISVAIVFPGLLLLQPFHLWRVVRDEREAITPRQRFRAVYPRTYNPSFAVGCCVLAVLLASAFTFIFPLVGPAACILLALTLIAHRFLIGYVYGRTLSQTGGLLQIWLLKRLGTILAFQPLILGLIFLSRRLWIEGGILCGVALFVVLFVEIYCTWKTRMPGRNSLSKITIDSLETFSRSAKPTSLPDTDEESTSLVSSGRNTRARGSFASILEMMSLTLAVMPSPSQSRGPVPLMTETLDDLIATERAARTHPDAPPHLPPLSFADHAEEVAGILYAPELLAPPPVIWLPNDVGGIARSEAFDLQRYHDLRVTLDVRATEDVLPFSPHTRRPRNIS